jgi:hypothetical protein
LKHDTLLVHQKTIAAHEKINQPASPTSLPRTGTGKKPPPRSLAHATRPEKRSAAVEKHLPRGLERLSRALPRRARVMETLFRRLKTDFIPN